MTEIKNEEDLKIILNKLTDFYSDLNLTCDAVYGVHSIFLIAYLDACGLSRDEALQTFKLSVDYHYDSKENKT